MVGWLRLMGSMWVLSVLFLSEDPTFCGWLASSHGVHVGFKVFCLGSQTLWLVGFVSWGPCGF